MQRRDFFKYGFMAASALVGMPRRLVRASNGEIIVPQPESPTGCYTEVFECSSGEVPELVEKSVAAMNKPSQIIPGFMLVRVVVSERWPDSKHKIERMYKPNR